MPKYLAQHDFNNIPVKNLVLEVLAAAPTSNLKDGRMYYNSTENKAYIRENGAWKELSKDTVTRIQAAGGTLVSGDITIDGSSNVVVSQSGSTISIDLDDTGVTAGEYSLVTVDAKGRITSASKPSNLADLGITDGDINGNASTADALKTARTIGLSGDATGSVSFDGSSDATIDVELKDSGVTAGDYTKVTVDAKGRVTAGSNPTTLEGYGITDAQPLDNDLTAISALSGTGLVRRTGDGTYSLDTNNYATTDDVSTAVQNAVDALVDGAPTALDTLNELAAALGDDANFAATVTNAIDAKPDKFVATIGDGSATEFTINHNLGTRDAVVSIREASAPYAQIITDVEMSTANAIKVSFYEAPAANSYIVTVIG